MIKGSNKDVGSQLTRPNLEHIQVYQAKTCIIDSQTLVIELHDG